MFASQRPPVVWAWAKVDHDHLQPTNLLRKKKKKVQELSPLLCIFQPSAALQHLFSFDINKKPRALSTMINEICSQHDNPELSSWVRISNRQRITIAEIINLNSMTISIEFRARKKKQLLHVNIGNFLRMLNFSSFKRAKNFHRRSAWKIVFPFSLLSLARFVPHFPILFFLCFPYQLAHDHDACRQTMCWAVERFRWWQ